MLMAVTRTVSSAIADCELSFIDRKPIDIDRARAQHHAYEDLLRKLGAQVLSLPEEPALPDSMFVEDLAIVLDTVAIICLPGTETRRREVPSVAAALEKFRPLAYIKLPGTLEGGDVLRVGQRLYAGLTERSNAEGIRQLAVIAAVHGYEVTAVPVTGCLHLKSAVTFIGKNTLLGNRAWFHSGRMQGFDWVDVDPAEAHAGNALLLGDTVVFPASFPRTAERMQAKAFRVVTLDISELQKAESGLTCSSLLFQVNEL